MGTQMRNAARRAQVWLWKLTEAMQQQRPKTEVLGSLLHAPAQAQEQEMTHCRRPEAAKWDNL